MYLFLIENGLDMIALEVQMENICVVCGAIIPEGRQVCPNCMEGFVPVQEQEDHDFKSELRFPD